MKSRYQEFVDTVAHYLSGNFTLTKIYHNDWVHKLIPDSLGQIMREEIKKALTFELSPTQTLIFNELSDENLIVLRKNIVGEIAFTEDFSFILNTGVKTSGLTKLYYDNLHWDKSEHLWGKVFKAVGCNPQPRMSFFKGMTCATKGHLAGRAKEEGGFRERETFIVAIFCSELAKFGTLKSQLLLAREIELKDNQPINIMRKPHDLERLYFANEIHSKAYALYENGLFNLLLRDKITNAAFKDTLPTDMSTSISFLLSKQDESNLVCVNKSTVKAKEETINNHRMRYRRQ